MRQSGKRSRNEEVKEVKAGGKEGGTEVKVGGERKRERGRRGGQEDVQEEGDK